MTEHAEQVALFQWSAAHTAQYPELALLRSNPNAGKRSYGAARWMIAEGLRSGVPDLELAVARDGYHGLYIEMKVGSNKPTPKQQWWLDKLSEQGYLATVCYGWYEAADCIKRYLEA